MARSFFPAQRQQPPEPTWARMVIKKNCLIFQDTLKLRGQQITSKRNERAPSHLNDLVLTVTNDPKDLAFLDAC
jgi:hypothetical protein